MDRLCKTFLDLKTTKRIHIAWKTRIHVLIQYPSPWSKINRHTTSETRSVADSLEVLLSQQDGQAAFRAFLKSEFCEENLDFWLACQEFKTLDKPDELKRRAVRIYDEFINNESPSQVNLDFYTKDIIRENLQHPASSCFAVAQKKIYSLMENGSFPRFIHSESYKNLFKSTSKQRTLGNGKML